AGRAAASTTGWPAHRKPPFRRHPDVFEVMSQYVPCIEIQKLQRVAATFKYHREGAQLRPRPEVIPVRNAHAYMVQADASAGWQPFGVNIDKPGNRLNQLDLQVVDPDKRQA